MGVSPFYPSDMSAPFKKRLCDVNKQLQSGQTLKGFAVSEAARLKLEARKKKLVEEREEMKQHTTETVSAAISPINEHTSTQTNAVLTKLDRLEALLVSPARRQKHASGVSL